MRRDLAPVDASTVCACTLPLQCTGLALSIDEQLLVIFESSTVSVYSLQALASGCSRDPVATWQLPAGTTLKQVRAPSVLSLEGTKTMA